MPTPNYDIAIIGGGIQGLYTAYLARQKWPTRSCAVFEKSQIGSGASQFAPGIQLAYGCDDAERTLSKAGQLAWDQAFKNWKWRPGRKLELNWITQNPQKIIGSATEPLKTLSVLEQLKLRPEQCVLQGTCSYDPVASVLNKLSTEFIGQGGHIYEHTKIVEIEKHRAAGLEVIDANGYRFTCRQAIVALGPWCTASPLTPMCQSISEARIKKVVAMILDVPPLSDDSALGLADDYAFFLPMLRERKWLFSFSSDDWGVTPEGKLILTSNDIEKARDILARYQLPHAFDLSETRVFCDAYMNDGLPRVEAADCGLPIYFIFGGGGNGFRFAPPLAVEAFNINKRRTAEKVSSFIQRDQG